MNGVEKKELVQQLDALSAVNVRDVDPNTVMAIADISIDKSMNPIERALSVIEQCSNPYIYRDGDMIVKLSFANTGKTMQSCMEDYLESELLHRENNCCI